MTRDELIAAGWVPDDCGSDGFFEDWSHPRLPGWTDCKEGAEAITENGFEPMTKAERLDRISAKVNAQMLQMAEQFGIPRDSSILRSFVDGSQPASVRELERMWRLGE